MSGLSPSEPPIVAFFFLKQKTAYEMRIRDWSSDVCSSDLLTVTPHVYTEVLPALEVEYRRMTSMGPFEIGGIGTYGSRVPASELPLPGSSERDLRGYVFGNGRVPIATMWRLSFSGRVTTSAPFLPRSTLSRAARQISSS